MKPADLFNADLFNADLFNADLFNADLFDADLFGTGKASALSRHRPRTLTSPHPEPATRPAIVSGVHRCHAELDHPWLSGRSKPRLPLEHQAGPGVPATHDEAAGRHPLLAGRREEPEGGRGDVAPAAPRPATA